MGLVIPNQITLVTLNSKCNHSNNVECLFERSVLYSTMGGFWGFEIMGWVSSCVYVLTGMYASLPNSWRCLCTIIHNTWVPTNFPPKIIPYLAYAPCRDDRVNEVIYFEDILEHINKLPGIGPEVEQILKVNPWPQALTKDDMRRVYVRIADTFWHY